MTSTESDMIRRADDSLKTPRATWTAALLSLGIYAFTLSYSVFEGRVASTSPVTYQVLSMLALLSFLAGIFLPQIFIKKLKKQKPELFEALGPGQGTLKELSELISTPLLVRTVLFELTALIGFSLGYITLNIENFYPCLLLGLTGLLYNFPTKRLYRRMLSI